ncbi:hypothetical protein PACID_01540 [Acidipropionibacterium acidipropionici ATCC 4875]|uniref:Uncharacterized protein n=1 Tax=Acidipropionibacterium acidipropionici (strain ATCC 4875 / DSM 20272 / JCM 6432 / NBRC 12425 / NCIMB 8070 / 4) TaxID=1171373 RepID=K7SFD8_ACIA4|nr:hypothetical protein PACID_01540 [Acidipropionibacterium acidipropionici ATCC 4875]
MVCGDSAEGRGGGGGAGDTELPRGGGVEVDVEAGPGGAVGIQHHQRAVDRPGLGLLLGHERLVARTLGRGVVDGGFGLGAGEPVLHGPDGELPVGEVFAQVDLRRVDGRGRGRGGLGRGAPGPSDVDAGSGQPDPAEACQSQQVSSAHAALPGGVLGILRVIGVRRGGFRGAVVCSHPPQSMSVDCPAAVQILICR